MNFFNIILYKPLFNSLIFLYNSIPGHDFGIAVILLTLIIKAILVPLSIKSVRSQKSLQDVQPKIKALQEKHKNDKEKQAIEVLELYKKEKINPFGGIFLVLIQLPILIALYSVFRNGLNSSELVNLYGFVQNPVNINTLFFGIIDLSKPNFILAVIAGICQFFQSKMLMPNTQASNTDKNADFAKMMQLQMTYFLPVFTVIILLSLPSALGLYWIVGGIFATVQQYLILKVKPKANLTEGVKIKK
jgi:YidC/Oxa1 family membrane protein insertase